MWRICFIFSFAFLPQLNTHGCNSPTNSNSDEVLLDLDNEVCHSNFVPHLDRRKFTQKVVHHQTSLFGTTFSGPEQPPKTSRRRRHKRPVIFQDIPVEDSEKKLSRKPKSLTDLLTGRVFAQKEKQRPTVSEDYDYSHLWTSGFENQIWPKEVTKQNNRLPWFAQDSVKCSDNESFDYDYDSGTYIPRRPCKQRLPNKHLIFHGSVLVVETQTNETLREILDLCTGVERYDIVEVADLEFLFGEIEKEISETDYQEPNSVVIMFNIEKFDQWLPEKIGNTLKAILNSMEDFFADVAVYSKFAHDEKSKDPVLQETLFNMKYVVSEFCRQDPSRCSDFSTALNMMIFKYGVHLKSDDPVPADDYDQDQNSTTLTPKDVDVNYANKELIRILKEQGARFCREAGLGVGSRAIEIRAATYANRVPFRKNDETSLTLSDILPLPMKSYDKNIPPKYQGQPTVVYFHVTVLSIDSINEESMTYVADIFLAQSWRDHRLRLPENMTEEYRILDVGWLQNIWRPDCFFKNAKKVTFHEMSVPNHYLWLYHDKTLLYMAKLTLVLSCAMKFEAYPFDTQVCSMMIESLSHTTFDLVFRWNITDPLVVNPEIELPQLDIASNSTEDCTLEYSTGNFTCLAVVFNLRRRLGYHLFHTYIPSGLIVVMSWISFWIKPEAIPARITLGVTSLLTLATQSTQSQRALPPVSYVKAIDVWMSCCTVFVFMSLMEFAVVNMFMGPIATKPMKGYSDPDIAGSALALSPEEKILLQGRTSRGESLQRGSLQNGRVRSRSQSRSLSRGLTPSPGRSVVGVPLQPMCGDRPTTLCIDYWSRFIFPFSYLVFNLFYWLNYPSFK